MTAIILRFAKRKLVTCGNAEGNQCRQKRFLAASASNVPAYCSYSCGVYGQPHLAKGVKRTDSRHENG